MVSCSLVIASVVCGSLPMTAQRSLQEIPCHWKDVTSCSSAFCSPFFPRLCVSVYGLLTTCTPHPNAMERRQYSASQQAALGDTATSSPLASVMRSHSALGRQLELGCAPTHLLAGGEASLLMIDSLKPVSAIRSCVLVLG